MKNEGFERGYVPLSCTRHSGNLMTGSFAELTALVDENTVEEELPFLTESSCGRVSLPGVQVQRKHMFTLCKHTRYGISRPFRSHYYNTKHSRMLIT